jgi:hypothetical protein
VQVVANVGVGAELDGDVVPADQGVGLHRPVAWRVGPALGDGLLQRQRHAERKHVDVPLRETLLDHRQDRLLLMRVPSAGDRHALLLLLRFAPGRLERLPIAAQQDIEQTTNLARRVAHTWRFASVSCAIPEYGK